MLINCVICSDLLTANAEVSTTQCGHLFHYVCLAQWLERSKSCPQCRTKTTEKNIHRVFFNVSNQEGLEDASCLQHKIDTLTFEIRLKNKDISNAKEELLTLNNKVIGLTDELKKVENKCSSQTATLFGFKQQVKYLQETSQNAEAAQRECKRLRLELQKLKNIETVVRGTYEEAEEVAQNYSVSADSVKSLAIFMTILKKELNVSREKRNDLNNTLQKTEVDLKRAISDRDKFRSEVNSLAKANKNFEADIKHVEDAKRSLQLKIEDLEKAILSPSADNIRDKALRRLIAESPAPIKTPCLTNPMEIGGNESQPTVESSSVELPVTPYLKIKHSSIGLTPLRTTQKSNFHLPNNKHSIFKNSRMGQSTARSNCPLTLEYDGLGGHSKNEEFPKPITSGKSLKRFKHSTGSKQSQTGQILKLQNYFDVA